MQKNSRYLITVLALVAFAASVASLYVHYKLLTDPTYVSFCDVSETVSCQTVFQSRYATVFGVPVAAGGAIWSALAVLLAWFGLSAPKSEAGVRTSGYLFLWSVIGLAAVLYFAYTSTFVLGTWCPLCLTVYACVAGIFFVSSGAASPMLSSLPDRLGADMRATAASPLALGLAALWLVGSASLVAFFPREAPVTPTTASGTAAPTPAVPAETLTEAQLAEWHAWLDAQPRQEKALPPAGVKVVLMKFNDYQCPACRATWGFYRDVIAKYEASNPGAFVYDSRDFPLEGECGFGGIHGAACEAAVAVRLAKGVNRGKEMEAWLFDRQPEMSRDLVKQGLAEVAKVTNFDTEYPKVLEQVRADARLGQELGVSGTPTFFLNGINITGIRPAHLDAAIAYLLQKQG